MAATIAYRQFDKSDTEEVYRLFRGSITDYVRQIGVVDTGYEDDIDAAWDRQGPIFEYLTEVADKDWIATDGQQIVGWARSLERDGHVQLTHFFVDPATQGRGVGRALLERAMPLGWGRSRSILATQNPLALSLYLKFGVEFQGLSIDFYGTPHQPADTGDLDFVTADDLDQVIELERDLLGYSRPQDLEFFASRRLPQLCVRNGSVVGYVFGHDGVYVGPAGVRDPADMALVLAHLHNSSGELGLETFHFTLPANSGPGVRWALGHGYKIDPFYEMLLASEPMAVDRFLMTQPSFVW